MGVALAAPAHQVELPECAATPRTCLRSVCLCSVPEGMCPLLVHIGSSEADSMPQSCDHGSELCSQRPRCTDYSHIFVGTLSVSQRCPLPVCTVPRQERLSTGQRGLRGVWVSTILYCTYCSTNNARQSASLYNGSMPLSHECYLYYIFVLSQHMIVSIRLYSLCASTAV